MPRAASAARAPTKKAPARKPSAKKAAPAPRSARSRAKPADARRSTTRTVATKKAPARTSSSSPSKKAPVKKTSTTKKAASATKAANAKHVPAKKAAVAKASAAKSTAKKAAPAKKATSAKRAAPAKKAPAKKLSAADQKFLDSQRSLLLEERDTYLRQAESLKAEADSLAELREPGDVQFDEESGEGDTLAVERERDLALSAQARAAIDEIDHALRKIDIGTYGICEVSGQPIPKERLKAIPWARERVEYKVGGFGRR
jgi:RNA polymerase-binding transcription factor DksA